MSVPRFVHNDSIHESIAKTKVVRIVDHSHSRQQPGAKCGNRAIS